MNKNICIKKIEESGMNLQLWAADILRKKKWNCQIDKFYTDDEERKTREIDLVAVKHFKKSLSDVPNFIKMQGDLGKESPDVLGSITVTTHLILENKYIKKNNNGWIFFSADQKKIQKGLNWPIMNCSYPLFKSDSIFSMATHFALLEKHSFRESTPVLIVETGQNQNGDKTNIRAALMGVIKSTLYEIVDRDYFKLVIRDPRKLLGRIINFKVGSYEPLNVDIYYPIVLVDGDLYLFNNEKKLLEERDHLILKQNYLSKFFLQNKKLENLHTEYTKNKFEIPFYVDFIKKESFSNYIDNIEKESRLIMEAAVNSLKSNIEEVVLFQRYKTKYGTKKAHLLVEYRKYKNLK